jgi:hypothetical protein
MKKEEQTCEVSTIVVEVKERAQTGERAHVAVLRNPFPPSYLGTSFQKRPYRSELINLLFINSVIISGRLLATDAVG